MTIQVTIRNNDQLGRAISVKQIDYACAAAGTNQSRQAGEFFIPAGGSADETIWLGRSLVIMEEAPNA